MAGGNHAGRKLPGIWPDLAGKRAGGVDQGEVGVWVRVTGHRKGGRVNYKSVIKQKVNMDTKTAVEKVAPVLAVVCIVSAIVQHAAFIVMIVCMSRGDAWTACFFGIGIWVFGRAEQGSAAGLKNVIDQHERALRNKRGRESWDERMERAKREKEV